MHTGVSLGVLHKIEEPTSRDSAEGQYVCELASRVVSGRQESSPFPGRAMTVAFVFLSATATSRMPATCAWAAHAEPHYLKAPTSSMTLVP